MKLYTYRGNRIAVAHVLALVNNLPDPFAINFFKPRKAVKNFLFILFERANNHARHIHCEGLIVFAKYIQRI